MIMEREKPSTWEKIIKDANSAIKKQIADDILLDFSINRFLCRVREKKERE